MRITSPQRRRVVVAAAAIVLQATAARAQARPKRSPTKQPAQRTNEEAMTFKSNLEGNGRMAIAALAMTILIMGGVRPRVVALTQQARRSRPTGRAVRSPRA